MNRREFFKASAAGLALAALPNYAAEFADSKKRVGLIGTGWYGKCDLWRLVQVAPVEIVSLCDVDKRMLAAAADIATSRQLSKKRPRTYTDYREMLKEKDLDIVLVATPDHWHALSAIAAMEAGADVYVQKAHQRGCRRRASHAGGRAQTPARGPRWAPSGAAPLT